MTAHDRFSAQAACGENACITDWLSQEAPPPLLPAPVFASPPSYPTTLLHTADEFAAVTFEPVPAGQGTHVADPAVCLYVPALHAVQLLPPGPE
eukprot:CAMPEP_0173409696 /NCGR_PEP_ID=MMETSP1356-20130122/72805_1 /TAXON_ID=77927 ORGANISM="Hemiselmis virescens, Strain PCC157" /NCGR_SAMPLE_ID=MMETSP1356 /ASSEMBLY_ACC=CAM_ASM_000847 /LENGTH=93 /DNA_ID=CAMNT_0014371211 /DNA_START=168 /DNA_END=449 /DNA_ORIENTATION=+